MSRDARLFAILAVAVATAFLWNLGGWALLDPDEGRYAEIPREMMESGDYVTPRLCYVDYFEKPALHYWLTAAAFAALGQNEAAARATPALLGLGGAVLVFFLTRSLTGRTSAAAFASIILATSLLWVAGSRLNLTDMTLTFFVTLALFAYWKGMEDDSARSRRWLALFYAGMALAMLSKGLIGVVLPGGVVFCHLVAQRRLFAGVRRVLYLPGVALFTLIAVPWFWAVCRANPDFFHFFFIQEHFLRYATKMHHRYKPAWFFVPILIGGLTPWAGLLPDMAKLALRRGAAASGFAQKDGPAFLGLWFVVPFLFFSFSSSKLIPYILPCLPPLAALGGTILASFDDAPDDAAARRFVLFGALALLPLAAAGLLYPLIQKNLAAADLYPYTLPASVSLLAFWGAAFCLRGRSARVLCALSLAVVLAFTRGTKLVERTQAHKDTARLILAAEQPGDVIVAYRNPMQGLFFYLKRRVVLADFMGELRFGATKAQKNGLSPWFLDPEGLKRLWAGEKRVLLVVDRKHLDSLTALLGEDLILLDSSANSFLFTNQGVAPPRS